ncbi:hypothetical protein [Nocardioides sp.]|uniref:hypothetical protein n=1 Tax=Nocardioides sp. TaxID=35761 RepID=UPI002D1674A2|nr:hypothetical protein [Nocardioides sp.]HXH78031.1 hypothetical protein [Nocardioides sp.]
MSPRETDRARYERDLSWLWAAVHELPSGVLWGTDAASREHCDEMMAGLQEFERVLHRLGLDDHGEFIEGCRWHFEHYPHYLERRRHFIDYATYTRDRRGPTTVPLPAKRPR